MRIKSIVAGAAIAFVTGVGSVSADELSVAKATPNPGTTFTMLDGLPTAQMSHQEMAAIRGAGANDLPKLTIMGLVEPYSIEGIRTEQLNNKYPENMR